MGYCDSAQLKWLSWHRNRAAKRLETPNDAYLKMNAMSWESFGSVYVGVPRNHFPPHPTPAPVGPSGAPVRGG